mmetsp:Transcript_40945/g.81439  ORF Transcript_40945/g.81439 Transcript_40945/m.81439 type:complete len:248 (+) Transcript_40945:755-1498(+)
MCYPGHIRAALCPQRRRRRRSACRRGLPLKVIENRVEVNQPSLPRRLCHSGRRPGSRLDDFARLSCRRSFRKERRTQRRSRRRRGLDRRVVGRPKAQLVLPPAHLDALLLGGRRGGLRIAAIAPEEGPRPRVADCLHLLDLVGPPQIGARATLDLRDVGAQGAVDIRATDAQEDAQVHAGPTSADVRALRAARVFRLPQQGMQDSVVLAVHGLHKVLRVCVAQLATPHLRQWCADKRRRQALGKEAL